ncbi:MAG TPA: SGNH/GDSL hydrolase family protein [Fimbriimonadaceae bacterium]|nr:SGNH/GDSL hydrolase family protein [Fimbriimonadaceae bacterium]
MKPLALASALATVAFAAAQAPAPPILQNVHRIVCLGDSITEVGENPGGYVWLVRHYLGAIYPEQKIEVLNAGVSGNKAPDMIARYQRDVLDKRPDLITISVGVNDVWHGFYDNHPMGDGPRGTPLDVYRADVEKMVQDGLASGAKIVILSATVIHEELDNRENAKAEAYNKALRDIAREHHLVFVDYQKVFRSLITDYRKETGGRDLLLTVDGVHMNAEGNKVMAHALLTGLGVSPEAQAGAQAQVEREERGQ